MLLCVTQPSVRAQELRYALTQSEPDNYRHQASLGEQQGSVQPLSAGQLEQLVAPIALYPDSLVAQILAAATYPQQVADADQWRHVRAYASSEEIASEADVQPWDPSVKALTAFPQVLAQMDHNLQWTADLGNAYYNQPEDVLEAVQVMRGRAQAAGNLRSTPQQIVRYNASYIELVPADPQVVYVPTYNPWTVYGEPMDPYPGFSLFDVLGDAFGGPLRYGLGIAISAFTNAPWGWLSWGLNWLTHALLFDNSDYYSHSNTVADWGFRHRGFHAYAGHGGFGPASFMHTGLHGEGWQRGGYGRSSWHSFGGGDRFGTNRGGEWHSFARSNTFARNRERGSQGFRSFRGTRSANAGYRRGFGDRSRNNRTAYPTNFYRGSSGFRGSHLENGYYGRSSYGRSSGSRFGSYYGSSHVSPTRSGRSGGSHWFSGHSQKSFGGKSWGGGFHSGGGGHRPKSFGGRGFGGGHSRSGGHSGGHGGGSRHHR